MSNSCDFMDCYAPGSPDLHHLWVCSNSCPLSWWCYLIISSSATPFSFLPSIFPSIRFFSNKSTLHIRWWNIRASVSSSVLPMNIQDWFPLELIGLISLLSKSLLQHNLKKINSLTLSLLYGLTLTSIHDYLKNHRFDYMELCWQSDVSAF